MTDEGSPEPGRRPRVLMVTEGTYPFHWGGVSTWCHLLLNDLPGVDFSLLGICADPDNETQFALPPNVVEFRPVPLWGLRELLEAQNGVSLAEVRRRRAGTSERLVEREFVPWLRELLRSLYAESADMAALAQSIHGIYRFFLAHDLDAAMRSQAAWRCFVQETSTGFAAAAARYGYNGARYSLADVARALQSLYHWLYPIGVRLPETDVVHAAMAGICTLVAVAAKMEHGAAFMLTEHGVYLRERYLAEATTSGSLFLKLFGLNFARRMTELSYAVADQVSPCCDYNQRWELRNGARPETLRTIYYGVDSSAFAPGGKTPLEPPVVVWVGRIDPLKDLFTLLRAAAVVHQARPDIEFRLFGSAPPGNEAYYEKCLALRKELGLEGTVIFAGYRSNAATAFNEGDVVLLSSVSEAFPFVILEAMLCEKPVVATAVGGVPEEVEGCGIVVEPRNPEAMAQAVLSLMNDPERCLEMGRAAREKAVEIYSVRQSGAAHEDSYARISGRMAQPTAVALSAGQANGSDGRLGNGHASGAGAEPVSQPARALFIARPGAVAAVRVPWHGPAVNGHQNGASVGANGAEGDGRQAAAAGPAGAQTNGQAAASDRNDWQARQAPALAALAEDLSHRDVEPIDALEITALLESMGITDQVASQRFGAPDAFALGEAVLAVMRRTGLPVRPAEQPAKPYGHLAEMLSDLVRGPLAMLPILAVLLAISAASLLGHWEPRRVLALSLGSTTSMLLTAGFIQASGRRASVYIGLGKWAAARRALRNSLAVAMSSIGALALLGLVAARWLPGVTMEERLTFMVALVAMSVLWLLAGALSLLQKSGWAGAALLAGVASGVAADLGAARLTPSHLAVGGAVGFMLAVALLAGALWRSLAGRGKAGSGRRVRLPSAGYTLYEAAPYFGYGLLYMLFVLSPHVVGWVGALQMAGPRLWAISLVEVGLTLPMAPLILAGGVLERMMRLFWRTAPAVQAATRGEDPHRFGTALLRFHLRWLLIYVLVLGALTGASLGAFRAAATGGQLAQWLDLVDVGPLAFVFTTTAVAYLLLGTGIYNCTFCLSLNRPNWATRAVVAGTCATLVSGFPLTAIFGIHYVGLAFLCGTLVYAAITWWMTRRLLASSDYYFVAAL